MNLTIRLVVGALVLTAAGCAARTANSTALAEVAQPVVECPPPRPLGQVQPPPDSPTLFTAIQLCFPTQGNVSRISGRTYLYYIQSDELITLPAQAKWMPFDETVEQVLSEDFQRLMDTGFLSDVAAHRSGTGTSSYRRRRPQHLARVWRARERLLGITV